MRFAAFFRNLNLGRPRNPSKLQFVGAFEVAGAHDVESVRSHGNILFSASGVRQACAIADTASERMRLQCGLDEPVFVRSLKYLGGLIASEPFAKAPTDDVDKRCVTFLPAGIRGLPQATIVTARGDAEIFGFQANEIFSVTRLIGGRPGPVNALLERRLRTRLTTRSWNTVCKLAQESA